VAAVVGATVVVCLVGAVWTRGAAIDRADGSAVLVLVEDGRDDGVGAELGEGVDGEAARTATARDDTAPDEERRADSILLVQWFRRCDAVSITSIPRDLVIEPDGEPVAVLNHTIGPAALAALIERTFDVAIVATSVLDVTDVERLAAELGPVTIELPAESRDRYTGFQAEAGPIDLAGDELTAYLRSRAWEEWRDGSWIVVDATDLDRIDRLHGVLRAAAATYGEASIIERLRLGLVGARTADVGARDPLGALGFALGASSYDRLALHVPPVVEDRTVDDRRSPFDPDDLGSGYRLHLAEPGVPLPDPCSEGSDG
jgi:hypothetical protein